MESGNVSFTICSTGEFHVNSRGSLIQVGSSSPSFAFAGASFSFGRSTLPSWQQSENVGFLVLFALLLLSSYHMSALQVGHVYDGAPKLLAGISTLSRIRVDEELDRQILSVRLHVFKVNELKRVTVPSHVSSPVAQSYMHHPLGFGIRLCLDEQQIFK